MNYQNKNLNIFDELSKIENINPNSTQETTNNSTESANAQDWFHLLNWEDNSEEENQD
jgi:hypothetical protein